MSDRIDIEINPPSSEARRDRVERQVFAQLAQMKLADRVEAAVPPSRRRAWLYAGMGALAAATIAVIVVGMRPAPEAPQAQAPEPTTPSRVVTPVGGTSQFEVGDAVIVAASDTSVEVKHAPDGGITLVLARGAVDCDVAPRKGRPPFHVDAGTISVEVVGTRFTVQRTPSPRVEVVRGKVRVTAPGGQWLVGAGETWTPQVTAQAEDRKTDVSEEQIEVDQPIPHTPAPPTPITRPVSPHAAYQAAVRLATTDPAQAAKAYRTVANGKGPDAALALMDLAALVEKTDRDAALAAYDEYLRRFPRGANVEEVTWLRIDVLRSAGRRDEARAAAAEYLRQFPSGTYAEDAARIR